MERECGVRVPQSGAPAEKPGAEHILVLGKEIDLKGQ